ncbi:RES family NAD+ phosphorylase [Mangrovicoccus sp. HB161399]|uniref:RES family NAD+ phosphorylase n=1 Tax=Mangrovicoccus sp. HB161399 TaxID=2720392 RepID=UPI0015566BF3|nr:RES family NAD+ phosphorylase [Mangrovicoccus sp. HB161399]
MRRDPDLLDALEAIPPVLHDGPVWRLVREGRDPLQCSASGGRWDDGSFAVLYTSLTERGALEEMRFHLMRGQPVMPSKVRYSMHRIGLVLERALRFLDLAALAAAGLRTESYGRLSYAGRQAEYPRTQEIGEAAHFLDFDGLIVPSARSGALNAVVFCSKVPGLAASPVEAMGPADWGPPPG